MASVSGTSGNDFIHVSGDGLTPPGGYNDIPNATDGNDVIAPGAGNDYVYAGGGDDEIDLNPGDLTSADTIDGGSGNDVLYLLNTGTSSVTLDTSAFANVSHIEGIVVPARYHGAPTTIDLTDALVGSSDDSHRLTVYLYNEHSTDYVNIATVDASAVTTSTNSVIFIDAPYGTQSGSSFTMIGGAGADSFIFYAGADGAASLPGTSVNGGTGASLDTLQISYNGATSAGDLANVSHIEIVTLAGGGTNSIVLPDALVGTADDSKLLTVNGGSGDDTLDASLVTTSANHVTLMGYGGADTFKFGASNLNSGDTVNGGSDGAIDTLAFATAGTVATSAFANVSHIEAIQLADGTNNIALPDALAGSADDGQLLTIYGGSGNDSIDPRAITTASNSFAIHAGAGNDTIYVLPGQLTAGDSVDGGTGIDTLYLDDRSASPAAPAYFPASTFANVSHIETLSIPSRIHVDDSSTTNATIVTLTDALVASSDDNHRLTIAFGGESLDFKNSQVVDGSGVTTPTNTLLFTIAGNGAFNLTGGAGADVFRFDSDQRFGGQTLTSNVTVNGGTGPSLDSVVITLGGTYLTSSALTNVTHIEQIVLPDGNVLRPTNDLVIPDSLASTADDNQLLTVNGGAAADTIDASAATSAGNKFAIYGGGAADTIILPSLNSGDTIDGGNDSASDTLAIAAAGTIAAPAFANVSHIEVLQLANGTNSVALNDAMVGSADDNHVLTVKGGSGTDTIDASAVTTAVNSVIFDSGAGNDNLTGGAGNDTAIYSSGFLTFDGGSGSDTIDMSRFGSAIWFGHNDPSGIEVWTKDNSDYNNPGTDRPLVNTTSVENVIGTAYNDVINGDAGDNVYTYTGGLDTFNGYGGTNTLDLSKMTSAAWFGYTDPSGIEAWTKDNSDISQSGTWRPIVDTANVQNIIGTPYNDQINGNDGNNTYTYTGGFDLFDGHGGNNTLDLSRVSTSIWFGYTDSSGIEAWSVFDSGGHTAWQPLVNTTNVENVIGTPYNDQFYGDGNANTYTYTGGFDTFVGGGGSDTLDMSRFGSAIWYGHTDPSGIEAWTKDNSDYNLPGTDRALVDTSGVENVIGTAFNDQIYGDAGANVITGGGGADLLVGYGGGDTYAYTAVSDSTGPNYDTIVGFDMTSDRFDLPGTVTGIDTAVTSGSLSTATFDSDLASILTSSHLAASHAVLVTPSSGDLAGHTFLVVDANAAAGYQAEQDFVFALSSTANIGALSTTDFI